uniref:Peptidase S1 domain-containing protein n=1 Tax=Ascaris lumbricoides TaxID=6252 RepID=A0A0M3IRN5_ASCLU
MQKRQQRRKEQIQIFGWQDGPKGRTDEDWALLFPHSLTAFGLPECRRIGAAQNFVFSTLYCGNIRLAPEARKNWTVSKMRVFSLLLLCVLLLSAAALVTSKQPTDVRYVLKLSYEKAALFCTNLCVAPVLKRLQMRMNYSGLHAQTSAFMQDMVPQRSIPAEFLAYTRYGSRVQTSDRVKMVAHTEIHKHNIVSIYVGSAISLKSATAKRFRIQLLHLKFALSQ